MEEKNLIPNSENTPRSWSELPTDVLNLVLEGLSFVNFERAKSTCRSWHSSSRQCVPKKQSTPWLILFPKDKNSCELFNPEEKHKLYKTPDLGLEFTKSICKATYGNWLLMMSIGLSNPYIINLFTQERINLPYLTSFSGRRSFCSFWIDEKTKDYIVFWRICIRSHLRYSRSGDTSWKEIPQTLCTSHMVYIDYKLFVFSDSDAWYKIFDFSRDVPKLTIQSAFIGDIRIRRGPGSLMNFPRSAFAVTVTGDVVRIVLRSRRDESRTCSFRLVKVYSSGEPVKKSILVESLGDEALFFDQGFTVLVNDDNQGFMRRNCIYFTDACGELMVYDMETRKTEPLDSSLLPFSTSHFWFLPSF